MAGFKFNTMTSEIYTLKLTRDGVTLLEQELPTEMETIETVLNYLISNGVCQNLLFDPAKEKNILTLRFRGIFGKMLDNIAVVRVRDGDQRIGRLMRETVKTIETLYFLLLLIDRSGGEYPTYWINITLPDGITNCMGWCGFSGFSEINVGGHIIPLPLVPNTIVYQM
jgi:hypothetical protein